MKSRYDMGSAGQGWEDAFRDEESSYMPADVQQSVGGGKGMQQMRMGAVRPGKARRVTPRGKK